MPKAKFGDCLKELLEIREWSAARLAKMLNIDASYVRRWIRGERTPAMNSNFIGQIANVLSEGLDKPFKKAISSAIEQFIQEREGQYDRSLSMHDLIMKLLHSSQVYSLSLDNESRKSGKPDYDQRHVAELLEKPRRRAFHKPLPSTVSWKSFEMTPIPKTITGRESMLKAAILMLKHALEDEESDHGGELVLTFQSEKDYFEGYPELHNYWQQLILQALNKGWTIDHFCKLNKNVQRSLRLVNQIMDWSNNSGTYRVHYFNKYGIHYPTYEIIAVRGRGAMLGFTTENDKEIDAGLYLDESAAFRIIEKFAEQMFPHVEPLMKILTLNDYFTYNTDKDRKSGNHLVCMHELCYLTVPFKLMEKYLLVSIPDEHERAPHLRRIEDSLQSFWRDIQSYKMRHIYPMMAIEQLVKTGKYVKNPYFRPTHDDIVEHLRHLIWLLKSFDRFEIALVGESQLELLNHTEWEVKGDHTIMIGVMPRNGTDRKVELIAITEGTLVSAFQEYFDNLWDRINPIHREKDFVISWIESRLHDFRGGPF